MGLLVLLSCLGCGASSPAQKAAAPPQGETEKTVRATPYEKALAALKAGKWSDAQTLLESVRGKHQKEAVLVLGELFLLTGRHEEVDALLGAVKSAPADLIIAESLRRRGELGAAKERLTVPRETTTVLSLSRSVALGEILVEEGKRSEAESVLMKVIEAANAGEFDALEKPDQARAWAQVGRAAHLLRSAEDANEAFNESETLARADLATLLFRAELFLEKFDFAHAAEVLSEAEKIAPHHPDFLILKAHLALYGQLAFAEVEEIAKGVLETNPRSTRARFLLAAVALRDLAIKDAMSHVEKGLGENPRDLQLLSMKAAVLFLAEDPKGFEAVVDETLEYSPGYSEIFRIVGEYAEWEHRYPDIEKLMRRAVRLDREDGRARSLLGLTLVRSGSDAAGLVELRRAFELDPYNVRVLNTLNLYEKTIPEEYVEKREGPFSFRFPKDEAPLLERYVPQLLEKAHAEMVERYQYTPVAPIGIEIYQSRDQFAVRTSGLPQTAIAGVCFGRKLATVSPIGSPGNLGMTLWHELAHVFHIGLSENRVPRWLTEGLAEWETAARDVGWSREMDLELYRALRQNAVPSLGSMSRAFTHARRMSDVANAYYASGQIAEWIVDTHGRGMAQSLLAEFGKKKLPPEVVPPLLGASFEELDEQFRSHVREELERFESQFVSVELFLTPEEIEEGLRKDPLDYDLRFQKALLHFSDRKFKRADAELQKLLGEKFDPHVSFARTRLLLATEQQKKARVMLRELIDKGHDGYEVRMILGRLDLAAAARTKALSHLEQAVKFDPLAEEAWAIIAAIYNKLENEEGELEALRNWAALSEHDPTPHRRLIQLLIDHEKYEEAKRAGELAIWADLAGLETHRLYGLALFRAGDEKGAEYEFESALLCPALPTDLQSLTATWISELERVGKKARAAEVAARIAGSRRFSAKKSGAPPPAGVHIPDVEMPDLSPGP